MHRAAGQLGSRQARKATRSCQRQDAPGTPRAASALSGPRHPPRRPRRQPGRPRQQQRPLLLLQALRLRVRQVSRLLGQPGERAPWQQLLLELLLELLPALGPPLRLQLHGLGPLLAPPLRCWGSLGALLRGWAHRAHPRQRQQQGAQQVQQPERQRQRAQQERRLERQRQ